MDKQSNVGSNNSNVNYTVNGDVVLIYRDDMEYLRIPIHELQKEFAHLNRNICIVSSDLRIKVLNKVNNPEKFDPNKIVRSLVTIGVSVDCAISIAEQTVEKVRDWTLSHQGEELKTKIIRKMVSETLQSLDSNVYSILDIERWNTKYIHKYGHNNRIVEIYSIPREINKTPVCEISFEFVRRILLPDIINTIAPKKSLSRQISTSHMGKMANEVIELLNSCDLYRIKYNLLKEMIVEIATQPPHPWIIDDDLRSDITNYDREALKDNLDQARAYKSRSEIIPYAIAVEIMHHAASLVMSHYFTFMGSDDLSVFFLLLENIERILTADDVKKWDEIASDYVFATFYDDFALAGVSPYLFCETMRKLASLYANSKTRTEEFSDLLLEYGQTSLKIDEFGNSKKIIEFIKGDWADLCNSEKNENIYTLLRLLSPCPKPKTTYRNSCCFWIRYNVFVTLQYSDLKSNVFVLVETNGGFDYNALNALQSQNTRRSCNTVFFVTNKEKKTEEIVQRASDEMQGRNLTEHYFAVILDRTDLKNILYSKNRMELIDDIIQEQEGMFLNRFD